MDRRVESLLQRAEVRWPLLRLGADQLQSHVLALQVSEEAMQRYGTELCLTLASSHGDSYAIQRINEEFMTRARRAIRRIRAASDLCDDALQLLSHRLFVGAAPRISRYAARAPLDRWLEQAAKNVAFNWLKTQRLQAEPMVDATFQIQHEPRSTVTNDAQVALNSALNRLSLSEVRLLGLQASGMSIDVIGRIVGLHKATCARRLIRLKLQLRKHAVESLRARGNLTVSEAIAELREAALELSLDQCAVLEAAPLRGQPHF